MDEPVRCAVIGQNPMCFPWGFDEEDEYCSRPLAARRASAHVVQTLS